MGRNRTYTPEERVFALAALELNEGRLRHTAAEIGVPVSTLAEWRDEAMNAGLISWKAFCMNPSAQFSGRPSIDYEALWAAAQVLAVERLREAMQGTDSIVDLARVGAWISDRHWLYETGRCHNCLANVGQVRR